MLKVLKNDPIRCSWKECLEIIYPGEVYQINELEYWHTHCFESPAAGLSFGGKVTLIYNCEIPKNPIEYFRKIDLNTVIKKKSIKELNSILEDTNNLYLKKSLYINVIDLIMFNREQEVNEISSEIIKPANLLNLAEYFLSEPSRFSDEVLESFEREFATSDESNFYYGIAGLLSREPVKKLEQTIKDINVKNSAKIYQAIAKILEENVSNFELQLIVDS
jgi:hypothetical protein